MAIVLGVLSKASFFATPAASFLLLVHSVLTLAAIVDRLRITVLLPVAKASVSAVSLYFLGEALVLENPSSLALGASLSISALLLAYVENKVLLLKSRIRGWALVVLLITAGLLVYTYATSLGRLSYFLEDRYGPVEVAAYSGLLYIGASLPYSSAILFSLVYLIYDTLNSLQREELPQPT